MGALEALQLIKVLKAHGDALSCESCGAQGTLKYDDYFKTIICKRRKCLRMQINFDRIRKVGIQQKLIPGDSDSASNSTPTTPSGRRRRSVPEENVLASTRSSASQTLSTRLHDLFTPETTPTATSMTPSPIQRSVVVPWVAAPPTLRIPSPGPSPPPPLQSEAQPQSIVDTSTKRKATTSTTTGNFKKSKSSTSLQDKRKIADLMERLDECETKNEQLQQENALLKQEKNDIKQTKDEELEAAREYHEEENHRLRTCNKVLSSTTATLTLQVEEASKNEESFLELKKQYEDLKESLAASQDENPESLKVMLLSRDNRIADLESERNLLLESFQRKEDSWQDMIYSMRGSFNDCIDKIVKQHRDTIFGDTKEVETFEEFKRVDWGGSKSPVLPFSRVDRSRDTTPIW